MRTAVARGHRVIALHRGSNRQVQVNDLEAGADWIQGSLADPPWDQIKTKAPKVCVHLAWITTPGLYLESTENHEFLKASRDFLAAAMDRGVTQLLVLGTCLEYAVTPDRCDESTTPVAPQSTYSRCKHELRLWLEQEAPRRGVRFAWGRVFYPYGPGEPSGKLVSSVIRSIAAGQPVELKTPHSLKDYIFVDDLAAAMMIVVESGFSGVINLGTGIATSVADIAQSAARIAGNEVLVRHARTLTPDSFPYVVAKPDRLLQLGWQPATPLADGIQQTAVALEAPVRSR